jgi:hypothetical protein
VSQFVRDYYAKPSHALTQIGLAHEIRAADA